MFLIIIIKIFDQFIFVQNSGANQRILVTEVCIGPDPAKANKKKISKLVSLLFVQEEF